MTHKLTRLLPKHEYQRGGIVPFLTERYNSSLRSFRVRRVVYKRIDGVETITMETA